jgi:hypothetical protein
MARVRWSSAVCGALSTFVICGVAAAQFGFVNLPQNDFTWTWGDPEDRFRGREDIAVSGFDAQFRCDLTAGLRPGSRLTTVEVREIENQLQGSIQFVRDAVELLNALDLERHLEWAQLVCKTAPPEEVSAEERLERETKARERMQREVERRRARQRDGD